MTPKEELVFRRTRYEKGCWVFTGSRDRNGYGRICRKAGGTGLAHRSVYIALVGDPGDGVALDHLCRNPACVNPWHLEPVGIAENVARGANKRDRPACKQGHPYAPETTRLRNAGHKRVCMICNRLWQAKYKASLRSAI